MNKFIKTATLATSLAVTTLASAFGQNKATIESPSTTKISKELQAPPGYETIIETGRNSQGQKTGRTRITHSMRTKDNQHIRTSIVAVDGRVSKKRDNIITPDEITSISLSEKRSLDNGKHITNYTQINRIYAEFGSNKDIHVTMMSLEAKKAISIMETVASFGEVKNINSFLPNISKPAPKNKL